MSLAASNHFRNSETKDKYNELLWVHNKTWWHFKCCRMDGVRCSSLVHVPMSASQMPYINKWSSRWTQWCFQDWRTLWQQEVFIYLQSMRFSHSGGLYPHFWDVVISFQICLALKTTSWNEFSLYWSKRWKI